MRESDTERFLGSAEFVCCSVLQCQLQILVRTPEGTREDGFTEVQTLKGTYIRRKYDHSTNLQNQIWITLDLSAQIMKYLD